MSADPDHDAMRKAIAQITKEWADKGKILEGGWRAFAVLQLKDAHEMQIQEMRKAYFLGAQHLFASILNMLDPGTKETEQDLRRMKLISKELDDFRLSLTH